MPPLYIENFTNHPARPGPTYHIIFVVEKFLSEAVVVVPVLLVMFVFGSGSTHCPALAPVKRRGVIVGRQILVRLTVRQQTGNKRDNNVTTRPRQTALLEMR